jgi:probable HAF family extracellular repeat protein
MTVKIPGYVAIAFRFCLVLGMMLPAIARAQSGNYTFVNIDYPGETFSTPEAINDSGNIVGWYQDGSGNRHGFLYDGSTYSTLDYPGADATYPEGINNSGVISGEYLTNHGTSAHGFIYENGTYTSFDEPNGNGITDGQGINNNGEVVGYYNGGPTYGFFLSNGGFTSFNYPGAYSTYPHALNDAGKAAGYYRVEDASSPIGFYYDGSTFTSIEYPGGSQTYGSGINNAGTVVGYSNLNSFPYSVGFLWYAGQFTTINSNDMPAPNGINNNGQIVGTYNPGGNYHGFLATPGASAPLQFVPLPPCRVVDTRNPNGKFGGPPIGGHSSRSFPLAESDNGCGIPSGALAYSLNVTVVPPGRLGYLTIWPSGQGQPQVSLMNSLDGRIKANAAIVPAGTPSGSVSVYVTDTTNVLLDIDGYFMASGGSTLAFYPVPPCRIVDTRNPNGPLAGPFLNGNQERDFPVVQSPCLQGLTPAAYSLNVTAVPHPSGQRLGYITVWPKGTTRPDVSTLNNPTGTIVANGAIVPAGMGGEIAVFPNNNTDLLIDINGFFATSVPGGLSLYTVSPCRVIDTRNNHGQPFMGRLRVDVKDSACSPPATAEAYVLNATVVPQPSLGFLTLWADGQPQPGVSTLNAKDGAITSNMAIVPTTNGWVDAYANALTHLILDISSYFAP